MRRRRCSSAVTSLRTGALNIYVWLKNNMPRRKHITITPQQARQLNEIGAQHGRGMFPDAFDPDDWADMSSMIDVPV